MLPELARPALGVCVCTWPVNPEQQTKITWRRAKGLSWFQPTYSSPAAGNAQCHHSDHITATGKEKHIYKLIQLRISVALLCNFHLYWDFSISLNHVTG